MNSLNSVLAVAAGLGIAKGIRSVYMALVVPSYVSIQKLPNASGIQMLTNGIILMCAGPIFGMHNIFTLEFAVSSSLNKNDEINLDNIATA
jgi:hypothetical protein